jgi:hypothetical protein
MTVKVALSACEEKTTLPADKFHMDQIEQTLKDNVKIDIFHHFSHPRRETCCGLETIYVLVKNNCFHLQCLTGCHYLK